MAFKDLNGKKRKVAAPEEQETIWKMAEAFVEEESILGGGDSQEKALHSET